MLAQGYFIILFAFLNFSTANSDQLRPYDVRIDHHKVETTRDLIINTRRPRFSWKFPVSDSLFLRNVQQTAYQVQLQSIPTSQFKWDTERVVSTQSIHVPYTSYADLFPATMYRCRLRVWTTESRQLNAWTEWIRFRTPVFDLHQYVLKNSDLH